MSLTGELSVPTKSSNYKMTFPDSLAYHLDPSWVHNYSLWPQHLPSVLRVQVAWVVMVLIASLRLILGSSALEMQKESLESLWFTGKGCKWMSVERIWQTLSARGTSNAPSVYLDSGWTATTDSTWHIPSPYSPSHQHPWIPLIIVVMQSGNGSSKALGTHFMSWYI